MKTINPHQCHCEFLMELTFQETFKDLDARFVHSCTQILPVSNVILYLGDINTESDAYILYEYIDKQADDDSLEMKTVFPINLSSGQTLSLVTDAEPNEAQLLQLVQLIAVFANQYEHLTRSNKDRLTNLKNRRSFDLEYERMIQDASNSIDNHVLAIIDIDHFKQVNDEYGHIVGDETLIAFANIMKSFFERNEYIFRFGGEEFIILLHDTSLLEAHILLEQLRNEIANYPFAQVGQRTASIGYIQLSKDVDPSTLFERADAALYYAKQHGRNCIYNYEKLVESELIEQVVPRSGPVELF